jgi:hypothetical protein
VYPCKNYRTELDNIKLVVRNSLREMYKNPKTRTIESLKTSKTCKP